MQLTFATAKGGTGKTTLAASCAAVLASTWRTAIVDLDPEAHLTVLAMGQQEADDPLRADPVALAADRVGPNLVLYRGGETIASAGESQIAAHLTRARVGVDFVLVDTPPDRRSTTVRAALRASDLVVVPVLPEFQSLSGLSRMRPVVSALAPGALLRVARMRWDARTCLARDVDEALVTHHPGLALMTAIPRDQRVAESAASRPVAWLAPQSPAARAITTLTIEIAALVGLPFPSR